MINDIFAPIFLTRKVLDLLEKRNIIFNDILEELILWNFMK